MQLTKFPVVLVLLTASSCRANILLDVSEMNETTSNLVEAVVNIVTSCHGDRIKGIGLAGNLPDALSRTLSVRHSIPTALIGDTYKRPGNRTIPLIQFRHKLEVFIVQVSTVRQFWHLIVYNIRYSIWFNHMASIYILDMSENCDISIDYLYQAWQLYLLNAKVLCYRRENGTVIFTYNPFTSQAPISWRQYKVFPAENGHPFTVFSRAYEGHKAICTELDFEKTKNLGGYTIRLEDAKNRVRRARSARGYDRFWSEIDRFFHIFSNVLNATVKRSNLHRPPIPPTQDIGASPIWLNFAWNVYMTTYPHKQIGYVLVSQFRGHKSQLNKILSVIDTTSQFGVGIVYFISFMFLKFFVRQALVPALLNLIRITCNTGLMNLPDNTAPRIYLGCLLFFAVTMQGIFQGNLAALLTRNIPHPNVNTLQDVVDFGYKEFCFKSGFIESMDLTILTNNFITVRETDESYDCLKKVREDPFTVYLGFREGTVVDIAQDFKLHISNPPLGSAYLAFNTRWMWALQERADIIVQKIVEADMLETWDMKCDPIKWTDFEFDEMVKNNQDFKNIELGELAFAFIILAIGLACATVIFIIELVIEYEFICRFRLVIVRVNGSGQ